MIPKIRSGIAGFDNLTGGLPENTMTLVYGPPKTGKSIFCYQFLRQSAEEGDLCMYLMTDYNLSQLEQQMMAFNWFIHDYISNKRLYVIDTASGSVGAIQKETKNMMVSFPQNPTDIASKLIQQLQSVYQQAQRFRSVLDSSTTLFAFNSPILIIRVLKSYTMRIKMAGGTGIITYTEGSAEPQIETMLKATADNIIHLDGEELTIEAMAGLKHEKASYRISDDGIVVQ
ncbi:MAG: RAD55 family ATPase [Euryarchaeota archaeon]|nr:RAD55 family ATPase [Euryarchaeota archaeon]